MPDEAVEAAAMALSGPPGWASHSDQWQHDRRTEARAALEAAAPYMLVEAWEEGHNHCFHVEDPRNPDRNPYK